MMRAIIEHASCGCLPIAVSAESISASAPSNTAARDVARLGARRPRTIRSSTAASRWRRCTGVCCSRQRPMISFCTTGTTSGDSSTPRSPRATITASAAATSLPEVLDRLAAFRSWRQSASAGRPVCRPRATPARRPRASRTTARRNRRRSPARAPGRGGPASVSAGNRTRFEGSVTPMRSRERAALDDRGTRPGRSRSRPRAARFFHRRGARDRRAADPPPAPAYSMAIVSGEPAAPSASATVCPASICAGTPTAGPNLRALQVLHHRDRLSARARFLAQGGHPSGVLLVCAVREIQSRDVHPRVDQGAYRLDVVGRRSQRTDDLGVAQAHLRWHLRD